MILRAGDRGTEVAALQHNLNQAGYPCGTADGIFGDRTTQAVKVLQAAHGLRADGDFGPLSVAALERDLEGSSAADVADASGGAAGAAGGTSDSSGTPWLEITEPSAPTENSEDPDWQGPPWTDEVDEDDPGHDDDHESERDPEASDRPTVPESFPDYFDNWDGELARIYRPDFFRHERSGQDLPYKGRPGLVDYSTKTHVCVHTTAVEYGTSPRKRRLWRQRIEAEEISAETQARYDDGTGSIEAMATRMALHERFWVAAYHWVGLLNGDVLFNNSIRRYTYHGNASNRCALGFSAESEVPARERSRGSSHTTIDDHFIDTNREALRLAVTTSREQGAPMTRITAHRAFSMTREGDPGEAIWSEVALPVARELNLEVDYDLVNGGRSIPRDWDPDSPFDWAGNRID